MNRPLATALLAIAAALALLVAAAACGDEPSYHPSATVVNTIRGDLEPTASVRGIVKSYAPIVSSEGTDTPPDLTLLVELLDTSNVFPDSLGTVKVLASQRIRDPGPFPIQFKVEYNHERLYHQTVIQLRARMYEWPGRLISQSQWSPVIVPGEPTKGYVELWLSAYSEEAEQRKRDEVLRWSSGTSP